MKHAVVKREQGSARPAEGMCERTFGSGLFMVDIRLVPE